MTPTHGLPLWSATQVGLAARDRTASRHSALIAALVPLAQELARTAGPAGITVADIRLAAVQRGLLSGNEEGRELSYLSAVPPAAGLKPTGTFRRSVIVKTHGNLNQVWRLDA